MGLRQDAPGISGRSSVRRGSWDFEQSVRNVKDRA